MPGAGKTTLANVLSENNAYPILSIDDYFTDSKGVYTFRHSENHIAYRQCVAKCEKYMQEHIPKIIVHNVFAHDMEWKPYHELAQKYLYVLHMCTVENIHGGANTHAIPEEQLERLRKSFKVHL